MLKRGLVRTNCPPTLLPNPPRQTTHRSKLRGQGTTDKYALTGDITASQQDEWSSG